MPLTWETLLLAQCCLGKFGIKTRRKPFVWLNLRLHNMNGKAFLGLDVVFLIGLMRSVHSRPTRREVAAVDLAMARTSFMFHSIKDHPTLHSQLEPHLWGFQRRRALSQDCVAALLNCSTAFGESVFLSCLWMNCMNQEGFSLIDEKMLDERQGFDYIGRLADHRERDMMNGWMNFRDQLVHKQVSHPILKCVTKLENVSSSSIEAVEGERRFLSYVLFGVRQVDRDYLKQTLGRIAEREVYW